jgi:hypothetical protein
LGLTGGIADMQRDLCAIGICEKRIPCRLKRTLGSSHQSYSGASPDQFEGAGFSKASGAAGHQRGFTLQLALQYLASHLLQSL